MTKEQNPDLNEPIPRDMDSELRKEPEEDWINDVPESTKILIGQFNEELQSKTNEIKNLPTIEQSFIEDLSCGLRINLISKVFNAEQLTNIAIQTYSFLKEQKNSNKKISSAFG